MLLLPFFLFLFLLEPFFTYPPTTYHPSWDAGLQTPFISKCLFFARLSPPFPRFFRPNPLKFQLIPPSTISFSAFCFFLFLQLSSAFPLFTPVVPNLKCYTARRVGGGFFVFAGFQKKENKKKYFFPPLFYPELRGPPFFTFSPQIIRPILPSLPSCPFFLNLPSLPEKKNPNKFCSLSKHRPLFTLRSP